MTGSGAIAGSRFVRLVNVVNTWSSGVWWGARKNIATKITATPTTCHQTEMSLSSATSRIPNVFRRPWRNSTTP